MKTQFSNPTKAGQFLVENLSAYANREDALVLPLARGGVPVATEVAKRRVPEQFDVILHYDHTRAVEPLERTAECEMGEVEETFPSGL